MASDSIANASSSSIPISSSSSSIKDFKKKRANRSARLKQCKLDVRREQWLSQVKNKGSKEEGNGEGGTRVEMVHERKERGRSMDKLEIKPRGGEEEIEGLMNNYSDSESMANSPTSHTSSLLGINDSVTNFTGSSRSSSSSSSGGCCSGCLTEEDEEGDDGCLDDWEAVADALAASDDKHEQQNHKHLPQEGNEDATRSDSRSEVNNRLDSGFDISKPKQECGVTVQRAFVTNCRAWRPDDAFRPQSLPNLSKQFSFPLNTERHFGRGGSVWGCKVASEPTSCPICYEDLDFTDTSFLPCSCGFRLCLFCHKRILEEDARCPGCRKQYDCDRVEGEATLDGGSLKIRLARSCSMVTRS